MTHHKSGITLLELLIVITLISVTFCIAIPAYRNLILKTQNQTNVKRLVNALHFARTQAILKKQIISVCPYSADLNCGNDWSAGIIIYNKKQILRVIEPFKDAIIVWNRKQSRIEFLADGRIKGHNGTFYYHNKQKQQASYRAVILSITGRIRLNHEKE